MEKCVIKKVRFFEPIIDSLSRQEKAAEVTLTWWRGPINGSTVERLYVNRTRGEQFERQLRAQAGN